MTYCIVSADADRYADELSVLDERDDVIDALCEEIADWRVNELMRTAPADLSDRLGEVITEIAAALVDAQPGRDGEPEDFWP